MSEPDYGLDLSCVDDLDPRGVEVSGLTALGQALMRRLDTPSGALVDDDEGDYGLELVAELSAGRSAAEVAALPARIAGQFEEDERVLSAEVVSRSPASAPDRIECAILVVPSGAAPFRMVLEIGKVAAELVRVEEVAE